MSTGENSPIAPETIKTFEGPLGASIEHTPIGEKQRLPEDKKAPHNSVAEIVEEEDKPLSLEDQKRMVEHYEAKVKDLQEQLAAMTNARDLYKQDLEKSTKYFEGVILELKAPKAESIPVVNPNPS